MMICGIGFVIWQVNLGKERFEWVELKTKELLTANNDNDNNDNVYSG